jgi:NADH-quinone oxidoreductase subunit F
VNNVESIAVRRTSAGAARLVCGIGRPNNTGTKLFCISGHVNTPCNVEEAMGIPFSELIEQACGRHSRRLGQSARGHPGRLVGAVHSGASVQRQLYMDFDTLKNLKTGLGTAAVIVMDKSTDIVRAIARISYFYKHEAAASARRAARARAGCGAC